MKRIIIAIIFIVLMVTTSCSNRKFKPYKFDKQEQIVMHDIDYPGLLAVTMQLVKVDSLLLINEFHGDSLIIVYNLNTNQIDRHLISKGEGPNELIPPLDLCVTDNNLYILSRPIFSLNHIPLDALSKKGDTLCHDYRMPSLSDRFIPLTQTQFVFSGMWKKRYAFLNTQSSDSLQEFGNYPDYWDNEKDIPTEAKMMFHQSMFVKHPTENKFVSCSSFVLQIFSYNKKEAIIPRLLFQKQLGKYEYDFTTTGGFSATLRKGSDPEVIDLACSENYIYLIVQNKKNRKMRDIEVIDWQGNPVKYLNCNKKIICLTIDKKEKKGYCVIEDPEEHLAWFNI